MIGPIAGIGGIALIVLAAEFLKNAKWLQHPELLRKFVHILTATYIATWPFFMSILEIQILSGLLLIGVLASKYITFTKHLKRTGISLRIPTFHAVHGVERLTYGELLFPVAVFLSASLAGTDWIFAAAMLHLGLADGMAAAIGAQNLGHMNYKVFGQAKSLIGSLTFYMVSVGVTAAVILGLDSTGYGSLALATVVWLPVTATLVENIAVFGTDNLLVPLLVIVALNAAQVAA